MAIRGSMKQKKYLFEDKLNFLNIQFSGMRVETVKEMELPRNCLILLRKQDQITIKIP